MDRGSWSDERLDDMVARNEDRFELLRVELAETRAELRAGFRDMREELSSLRREMHEGFSHVHRETRGEFSSVRRDMLHLTLGMIGAFAALFAALVAQSL